MKWILITLLMGSQNPIQVQFDDKLACQTAAKDLEIYVQRLQNGPGINKCVPTASSKNSSINHTYE